jgi:two-component system CheB/CheR fusion protein
MAEKGEKGSTPAEHPEKEISKSPGRTRFPVVGIGASAGGLEATTALLKSVPNNLGMAYVVLPHLDPLRESAFGEILSRTTRMPVHDAKDQTRVEANHVYVIPPNFEMTIVDGVLRLAHSGEARSVRTTIDTFLRSLAQDLGNYAIGVILSGTASDGTIGLSAIKGEGGITFAQDGTAKYDGMPASAIAAGCVDMVLPPEGIAKELVRIAQHPYVLGAAMPLEHDGSSKAAHLGQIFSLLRRATRVDFSEYKPPTIGRRVARRMALHKLEHLEAYVHLLQRDRQELNALYQDLLINVTSFFRDPETFEALKTTVYPGLLKKRENSSVPIRIWVPGCSTGEETYSHAISLTEFLAEERIEAPVQIFGTDLSDIAIQRARSGTYKETIEGDVSPVRLRRFFQKVDSGYQISKTIRDLCIFSTQNVFNDPPFSRIDLISCRNVMIYLSQSLQKRVIPVFHYALNAEGFLMLGNTEGLVGPGSELFDIVERKQKIYRKKSVPTPITFGFSIHMSEPPTSLDSAPESKAVEPGRPPADLQREADRLLLSRYAPPSVVVNDQLEILQTRGHTGAYLELPTGKISMNILKMARPGLLYELQGAIEEARKSGVDVTRNDVVVEGNGSTKTIMLRVSPFKTPVQDKASFLVVFEPSGGVAPSPPEVVLQPLSDDERTTKDKQLAQLKQELAATKEYLQSIIEAMEATNEELQSANEEIQSGNEELQSTNEELQTSKEELESANEELHTVNEEMQHRNEQLNQANNDLNNLLSSVNLPMVMVGPELNIRRFTPQAGKVLGLNASDVGRPIARLRLNLVDVTDLEKLMLNVIADVRPEQRRIRDADGRACELRLTPYRTSDNRIDGVVLSVLAPDGSNPAGEARLAAPAKKLKPKNAGKKKAKSK